MALRKNKYQWLLENDIKTTNWEKVTPEKPFYLLNPFDNKLSEEFADAFKITDVLKDGVAGLYTARDSFVISENQNELLEKIDDLLNKKEAEIRAKYKVGEDSADWSISEAKRDIQLNGLDNKIVPITYRIFDNKFTYYSGKTNGFICRPRKEVLTHLISKKNIAIITVRQVAEGIFNHVFVTENVSECRVMLSNKGYGYIFPLYLYPSDENPNLFEHNAWPAGKDGRRPNLDKGFVDELAGKIGLEFVSDGAGDLKKEFGPEDVLGYIYGIFHSPEYQETVCRVFEDRFSASADAAG